jgi:hypothetical protein
MGLFRVGVLQKDRAGQPVVSEKDQGLPNPQIGGRRTCARRTGYDFADQKPRFVRRRELRREDYRLVRQWN